MLLSAHCVSHRLLRRAIKPTHLLAYNQAISMSTRGEDTERPTTFAAERFSEDLRELGPDEFLIFLVP